MKWNSIEWNQLKKISFTFLFVIDWMDGMSFIWLASFIEEFHSSNYGVNGYMFSLQAHSHSISFNHSFINLLSSLLIDWWRSARLFFNKGGIRARRLEWNFFVKEMKWNADAARGLGPSHNPQHPTINRRQ